MTTRPRPKATAASPASQRSASAAHSAPRQLNLGRLQANLGFRLRRVQQGLSRQFTARTAHFGFSNGAISALALIEANPGVSQSAIAREMDVDASIAVGIINELRRRSLLTRTRLPDDRRHYMIQITAKGVALLDRVFEVVAETENEVLRCLAPSELLLLARIFDKLYAQLGESSVETLQPR